MRKLVLGLALVAGAQKAWSDCLDTTIVLRGNGNPVGFTVSGSTGTYDPDAAGAINSIFKAAGGCPEQTITVRLNLDATLAATLKDTVRLSNSIKINERTGKSTALTMSRASTNPPSNVLDTLFTLVETSTATNPNLLTVGSGNQVTLTNMAFARKMVGNNTHTVVIGAKGTRVEACHFWMADINSQGTGALLDIIADSVLVERSLFRCPPDGVGRPTGIHTGGSATKVEIRSNVFFSTGLQMAATGTFHVIANTFTGSRNEYNAIIIGNGISSVNNAVIMHNLFAHKADSLPPINFAGTAASSDSILRNAWSRGKPNLPLAMGSNGTLAVSMPGATGVNVNTPLPRGFSNYGPASGDVKDYALTQLRTDPLLNRKHADFGKIYRVFLTSFWSDMNPISSLTPSRFYFPGFNPFIAGKSWGSIKVGAFVDQDQIEIPSPLDSGAQGASLKFTRDTSSTNRIKVSQLKIDANYYKATINPGDMYFFFSNTLSRLTASNDTNVLKGAPNNLPYVVDRFLNFDSLIEVPNSVRTGGDIYVKMLHFRGNQQAAVQSNAVIATVTGFPSFPVNDLAITQDVPNSSLGTGVVALKVTRGSEQIDSVRIHVLTEAGQLVRSTSKAATGTTINFTINFTEKGRYVFQALPVAGGKAGQPTIPGVGPLDVLSNSSDTIYVEFKASCPGATGIFASPYCALDTALKEIAIKKGGTIILKNGTTELVVAPNGATDTSNVTITSGRFDENRPVLRGNTKEAVSITRRNVILRGFAIEMPVGSTGTALSMKAAGCVVDANIFRAASKGAVEGTAVNFEVGATAESRFVNNVVWGFTKNVAITGSASPNIKIINNTFVDDPSLANAGKTTGIFVSGTAAAAIVSNNYFSGIKNPMDTTVSGKALTLDHNVYTVKSPNLRGIADAGGLDSSSALGAVDVWTGTYTQSLNTAFDNAIDCNSLAPCNSLYAGSSANTYNVALTADFLGRSRVNRREVGAHEFAPAPPSVLGVLSITPNHVPLTYKRLDFVVSGKNFDPNPQETDSLHVFWTTTDVTNQAANALAALPANQRKAYPISKLASGSFKDGTDSSLKESTRYFFYAALGRNPTGTRKLGYAYSDTITTSVNLKFTPCTFDESKSACPSEIGIFGVDTGTWKGKFESRVTLDEAVASGTVDPPAFNSVREANVHNLDLTSPLPTITFSTKIPGLGTAGGKQKTKWQVDMYTTPDLAGLELFLLPTDPNGLAQLVPFWTLDTLGGGKSRLILETSTDGVQTFAFGKVQPSLDPGIIAAVDTAPGLYDFTKVRDSAVYHVPVKIKGSAFKTGNPLVLVSIVPAGATVAPPSGTNHAKVMSKAYHSRTLALSAGYGALNADLRKTRFHQHYLKAVAAEAASAQAKGANRPFALETVAAADFPDVATPIETDLAIAAGGGMGEITVNVPVGQGFKDYALYADQKGKASRSIEVVFTSFDGGRISRSSAFIRTHFADRDLHISEKGERGSKGYKRSRNDSPKWNLFGYPWDEADTGSLARIVERDRWNGDAMRVMRYKGSGEGASAFTASTDGNQNPGIRYDAGYAVWSGSIGDYTPKCYTGTSLDYQAYNLPLDPNIWNDISLPFNFNMKWQDILDASGLSGADIPAMWHWVDSGSAKWVAVTPTSTSPPLPGTVLKPWDGYTVKPTKAITLKFPVLDESRSATALAKPANDGSWAATIEASNATAAMDLQIGRGARESWIGEAPNIPGQDFRLALARPTPAGEEKVSRHFQALGTDWRGQWALRAAALKGSKGVSLRLIGSTRDVPVWLIDALNGTAVPLSKDAPLQVGGDALASNDYHLVAGDQEYVDGILKGMVPLHMMALGNYPNPFKASTLIRYALPSGFAKVRYDLKVRDFRGRTVWEKTIQGGNSLSYMWDGRTNANGALPAGVYSLSLTAHAPGKPIHRAIRGILKM